MASERPTKTERERVGSFFSDVYEVNQMLATSPEARNLVEVAQERMRQGLSPPAEIYQIHNRSKIDWSQFPDWARPIDPELFSDCCHEG